VDDIVSDVRKLKGLLPDGGDSTAARLSSLHQSNVAAASRIEELAKQVQGAVTCLLSAGVVCRCLCGVPCALTPRVTSLPARVGGGGSCCRHCAKQCRV
jgi:hypothetical protein